MDEYNFPLEKGKSQNAENLHQDGNFETIYRWLETIPFSKAPKTLARDFADGVLMAELLQIYYPRFIDVHNCMPTSNINMRKDNWNTLNRKVFSRIFLKLNNRTIRQLSNCHHGTIEKLLSALHGKLTNKDVNYLQELETNDISETKIENLEEQQVDSPETDSPQNNSANSISELETSLNSFSSFLEKIKNNLKIFMIWLMNVLCFWKYFSKYQSINENANNEIVYNNYPLEIAQQTGYINAQITESVTRWAYEQLIQEIHEKEDIITTLNHKVAYLEGMMRQKDSRITNLMNQVTNNSVEILPNVRQRLFTTSQLRLRPKSHNPLMMPNSYGS